MREEAVPVVLACDRVPGPVRRLGIDEDHPCVGVAVGGVRPDVPVALGRGRVGTRLLEPRVVARGVVHDQVGDHPDAALVRRLHECRESRRASRSRDGCRSSRRCRSRRREAARDTWARARCSRRRAIAGSRASRSARGNRRTRRRFRRRTRADGSRRRRRAGTTADRIRATASRRAAHRGLPHPPSLPCRSSVLNATRPFRRLPDQRFFFFALLLRITRFAFATILS